MSKSVEAFRTIGEVADELDVPKHVLRFWEGKFPHIRPMKRGGGRRYYRPEDMELLRGIRHLLHAEGYTIKGVQKILREQGIDQVKVAAAAATAAANRGAKARGRVVRRGVTDNINAGADTANSAASVIEVKSVSSAKRATADDSKSGTATSRPAPQDIIASAIRELEVCLEILSGASPAGAMPARAASKLRAQRS
ncbi:MAG TPA: MerR family transcriptional regulator [Hyphomicrobium sp.]|nr:MerR family transcriptional regulator [Hyphomicrobium sp.]